MSLPGDISFNNFTVGNIDLTDANKINFNYLNVYEDILRPVFLAEVEVLDFNDILGQQMISGKEPVSLGFSVPGSSDINFNFSLINNKNLDDKTQQNSGSMKYKTYNLRMASNDVLKNNSHLLAKSFNQPTYQTVQQALKTISDVNINIPDPTQGNQRLIANYEKVYDFLSKIHNRHVSQQYKSSLYTIFASRDSGVESRTFCTFEYLMNQSSVFDFKQDNTIGTRTTTESDAMNNILWLKVPDLFNTPTTWSSSSNKNSYNILVGKNAKTVIPATPYKIPLGENITGSTLSGPNSSTTPPIRFTHVDPSLDTSSTGISSAKVDRANFIRELSQNSVKFEINGNPNISVGQIITLNIPKKADGMHTDNESQMNDKILITKIRHKIMPLSVKPRYTMIVEGIKASYFETGA